MAGNDQKVKNVPRKPDSKKTKAPVFTPTPFIAGVVVIFALVSTSLLLLSRATVTQTEQAPGESVVVEQLPLPENAPSVLPQSEVIVPEPAIEPEVESNELPAPILGGVAPGPLTPGFNVRTWRVEEIEEVIVQISDPEPLIPGLNISGDDAAVAFVSAFLADDRDGMALGGAYLQETGRVWEAAGPIVEVALSSLYPTHVEWINKSYWGLIYLGLDSEADMLASTAAEAIHKYLAEPSPVVMSDPAPVSDPIAEPQVVITPFPQDQIPVPVPVTEYVYTPALEEASVPVMVIPEERAAYIGWSPTPVQLLRSARSLWELIQGHDISVSLWHVTDTYEVPLISGVSLHYVVFSDSPDTVSPFRNSEPPQWFWEQETVKSVWAPAGQSWSGYDEDGRYWWTLALVWQSKRSPLTEGDTIPTEGLFAALYRQLSE